MKNLKQQFDIDDKGNMTLTNVLDLNDILKDNYTERMASENGWTKERLGRHVSRIPTPMFQNEPLLIEYKLSKSENPEYARRCLRLFLEMYPQYKVSDGGI